MTKEKQLPFISVCVPTYKRPEFLSEFYWCYLNQDYPKERSELIILDDAGQYSPLIDTDRNVKLVSSKTRFATLGEKRNAFLSLMNERSEFLCIADDDDLYFPHWISTIAQAVENADLAVPSLMIEWVWKRNPIYRHTLHWGFHHAASAFRKSAFMELGGYPHRQRQEDQALFKKFEEHRDKYNQVVVHWKVFPYIVRRSGGWHGTYVTTYMDSNVYETIARKSFERDILLTPKSAERYLQMIEEHLKKHYEDDLVIVHHSIVGYGKLGINEPGYVKLDLPENMPKENYLILSGHCPSEIKVTFKKKVCLKGVMNGSSHWTPSASCLFLVSDNIVGYLFGPKDSTREMVLEPGDYTLEITSLDPSWKHSLWAIREIPEP